MFNKLIRQSSRVMAREVTESLTMDKLLLAQGAALARDVRKVDRIERLSDVEFRIFSQWGEDGIIEWLVHHNGEMPETFVEFGVEDYREANTRHLLAARNWRGLVMDGSDSHVAKIKASDYSWRHNLTAVSTFITKDNINATIADASFDGELGLLSVDIDGNDYWVWQAIDCVQPHIVITEYNAVFGDLHPISVPYKADFVRQSAHPSNLYYGASISALAGLAKSKGYTLLGTNNAGSNAFFIRDDRMARFEGRIAETAPLPSRFREGRDANGRLTYASGEDRRQVIAGESVVNVDTGVVSTLGGLEQLYSPRWKAMMKGSVPPSS
ncbi:MAG: hypothetical protein ABL901_07120 [Hyphomicrobiaceae bacterium]